MKAEELSHEETKRHHVEATDGGCSLGFAGSDDGYWWWWRRIGLIDDPRNLIWGFAKERNLE